MMLHGSDRHLLECGLKTTDIPAEVEAEYEIRRKIFHRMGGSGALGCGMIVEMLRSLGLGEFKEVPKVVVQWQDHIGAEVDVLYGSENLRCVLTGLADMGRLYVKHDERGVLEMPRHAVKLAAPVVDWSAVAEGTPVVVDGTKPGAFAIYDGESVWVLLNSNHRQYEYSPDRVRLSE